MDLPEGFRIHGAPDARQSSEGRVCADACAADIDVCMTQRGCWGMVGSQTLGGPFSAVSKPFFAIKPYYTDVIGAGFSIEE